MKSCRNALSVRNSGLKQKSDLECVQNSEFDLPLSTSTPEGNMDKSNDVLDEIEVVSQS